MSSIQTLYVVHHSHTDIGYTDLQERILSNHVQFIRQAIHLLQQPENAGFRWNCETLYCVEQFLNEATPGEQQEFFDLVRAGKIGVSASWLNMTDLTDMPALRRKTGELALRFRQEGVPLTTAMIADINGVSMGYRDVLLENGVEFFFTNIHTHHGMYPLGQTQTPYFWENAEGKRLLVWNGEHYNLGNALGIIPVPGRNHMGEYYFGEQLPADALGILHHNLEVYQKELADTGYPYDFLITSLSGVFSDNAPPNPTAIRMIEAYNRTYSDIRLEMVSLPELYQRIRDQVSDAPVYRGDLNDWWANGVGSTPYAVKHYREAQALSHLCSRLEEKTGSKNGRLQQDMDENLLLYSEHTWGHSSTISNPYDTMVLNLDQRKNAYASKAHEAASRRFCELCLEMGASPTYYNVNGSVKAISTSAFDGVYPVEFYVETQNLPAVRVTEAQTGRPITVQVSNHPRGRVIRFLDHFAPGEEKRYCYEYQKQPLLPEYTRHAHIGAEKIRDIVNGYDPESCHLLHRVENHFFSIEWEPGVGFTSFRDKRRNAELLQSGAAAFFTPVYERTPLRHDPNEERRMLGRNIRSIQAQRHAGRLTGVSLIDNGPVFTQLEFTFELPGSSYCALLLTCYREIPRIDFTLRLAKTFDNAVENVFLPLALSLPGRELWIQKGGVPFRPGIDQLPGTGMEYYLADRGLVYSTADGNLCISSPDVPLLYMGELKHHPIRLCDNQPCHNQRDVYSWIMNNTWETNFKLDLSGCGEFHYSLFAADPETPAQSLARLEESGMEITAFLLREEPGSSL